MTLAELEGGDDDLGLGEGKFEETTGQPIGN